MSHTQTLTEQTDGRQKALLTESKKNETVKKWQKVLGKCQEIPASKYSLMAAMMENQYAHSGNKGNVLFEEATTTNNIADFTRFALPLIRKSYPKLIADNLVGVQPMSQPELP